MQQPEKTVITQFQQRILQWFDENQRDLPWRKTRNPYAILVSEVMLQQTQVPRVIPKYEAWIEKFPTVEMLASARTADVLALWSGLGYNRRALYLLRLAQIVAKNPHPNPSPLSPQSSLRSDRSASGLLRPPPKGEGTKRAATSLSLGERSGVRAQLPSSVEALKKLPGIGSYTARAIACFAFDKQIAVVDTNIRKVIAIEFFNGNPPNAKTTQAIADQLLPKGKAYEWNQALMDYSSAMLRGEKVPIPKQSKFSGSNRFYRGQILKLLISHGDIPITSIKEILNPQETVDLDAIIVGLIKDKLVVQIEQSLRLP